MGLYRFKKKKNGKKFVSLYSEYLDEWENIPEGPRHVICIISIGEK